MNNTNDGTKTTATPPPTKRLTTLVYTIPHNTARELYRVVEGLRLRGILVLPRVGTVWIDADTTARVDADSYVWVEARGKAHRRVWTPSEYASLGEYIDDLARAVHGEPTQCMADGCTASAGDADPGYCSWGHYLADHPEDDDTAIVVAYRVEHEPGLTTQILDRLRAAGLDAHGKAVNPDVVVTGAAGFPHIEVTFASPAGTSVAGHRPLADFADTDSYVEALAGLIRAFAPSTREAATQ